jgi:hypothetical protein
MMAGRCLTFFYSNLMPEAPWEADSVEPTEKPPQNRQPESKHLETSSGHHNTHG